MVINYVRRLCCSAAEQDAADCNPLVVDLETKDSRTEHKMALWFDKDAFSGLEADDDEDLEIEAASAKYQEQGGVILGKYTFNNPPCPLE